MGLAGSAALIEARTVAATRLDREIRFQADDAGLINLRPEMKGPSDPELRRLTVGRLQHLRKMELAAELAPGDWVMADSAEQVLWRPQPDHPTYLTSWAPITDGQPQPRTCPISSATGSWSHVLRATEDWLHLLILFFGRTSHVQDHLFLARHPRPALCH